MINKYFNKIFIDRLKSLKGLMDKKSIFDNLKKNQQYKNTKSIYYIVVNAFDKSNDYNYVELNDIDNNWSIKDLKFDLSIILKILGSKFEFKQNDDYDTKNLAFNYFKTIFIDKINYVDKKIPEKKISEIKRSQSNDKIEDKLGIKKTNSIKVDSNSKDISDFLNKMKMIVVNKIIEEKNIKKEVKKTKNNDIVVNKKIEYSDLQKILTNSSTAAHYFYL